MAKSNKRKSKKLTATYKASARRIPSIVNISRREALIRQLDGAIRMWFLDDDPVCVHLLLMPAFYALTELGKPIAKAPIVRKPWQSALNTTYEWLLRAGKDPHDSLDIPPRMNEFLLWACIGSFHQIYHHRSPYMLAYQAYFALWLFPEKPELRENADAFLPEELTTKEAMKLGRVDFLNHVSTKLNRQIKTPRRR